jgi:hypothetical protein
VTGYLGGPVTSVPCGGVDRWMAGIAAWVGIAAADRLGSVIEKVVRCQLMHSPWPLLGWT